MLRQIQLILFCHGRGKMVCMAIVLLNVGVASSITVVTRRILCSEIRKTRHKPLEMSIEQWNKTGRTKVVKLDFENGNGCQDLSPK